MNKLPKVHQHAKSLLVCAGNVGARLQTSRVETTRLVHEKRPNASTGQLKTRQGSLSERLHAQPNPNRFTFRRISSTPAPAPLKRHDTNEAQIKTNTTSWLNITSSRPADFHARALFAPTPHLRHWPSHNIPAAAARAKDPV